MSPSFGSHRFENSPVPDGAVNRTPFGLSKITFNQSTIVLGVELQFAFPLVRAFFPYDLCFNISIFLEDDIGVLDLYAKSIDLSLPCV